MWFTLVVEDPLNYFVEQYHDTNIASGDNQIKHIPRSEFSKHWVNGIPLVTLIENTLGELAEDENIKMLKDLIKDSRKNPRAF